MIIVSLFNNTICLLINVHNIQNTTMTLKQILKFSIRLIGKLILNKVCIH